MRPYKDSFDEVLDLLDENPALKVSEEEPDLNDPLIRWSEMILDSLDCELGDILRASNMD